MSGLSEVIQKLEAQKAAIDRALEALRETDASPATGARRRGRPDKRAPRLTPEGRQRLRDAMKRRWAQKRTAAQARKRRGRPTK
jgi:hypothetical protein